MNREIIQHNFLLTQAKALYDEAKEVVERLKSNKVVVAAKNEILDLIDRVVAKKGRLDLPIISGKYLGKVSDRKALQSKEQAVVFVTAHKIDTFEKLDEYTGIQEKAFIGLDAERKDMIDEIGYLTEVSALYGEYISCLEVKKQSRGLKGLAKRKFDKEHQNELSDYEIKDVTCTVKIFNGWAPESA